MNFGPNDEFNRIDPLPFSINKHIVGHSYHSSSGSELDSDPESLKMTPRKKNEKKKILIFKS